MHVYIINWSIFESLWLKFHQITLQLFNILIAINGGKMLDKGDESNILIKIYHVIIFLILAFVWFNEPEKGILMEEKWKEKK